MPAEAREETPRQTPGRISRSRSLNRAPGDGRRNVRYVQRRAGSLENQGFPDRASGEADSPVYGRSRRPARGSITSCRTPAKLIIHRAFIEEGLEVPKHLGDDFTLAFKVLDPIPLFSVGPQYPSRASLGVLGSGAAEVRCTESFAESCGKGLARSQMRRFESYVRTLHSLVDEVSSNRSGSSSEKLIASLDGQPGSELRRLVPLRTRRRAGAFFTGSALAKRVVDRYRTIIEDGVICDPACGAGDLLVAAAEHLPVSDDVVTTLRAWSERLRGFDIHEEFVEATKLRLVLAALSRGARASRTSSARLVRELRGIKTRSGVAEPLNDVDLVLLNPPYGSRVAPSGCTWATGKVSEAATFVQRLVDGFADGTQLAAILPDVLRTGSRYARWREYVGKRMTRTGLELVGVFDQWADVDVFLFHATRKDDSTHGEGDSRWWAQSLVAMHVRDKFAIHVGAVVPHRDPHSGDRYKYIDARALSGQKTYDVANAGSRLFNRRTFKPPFVVIRRTSRPDEARRAVGTLITGKDAVAVENHLLVAEPRTGGVNDCKELLRVLSMNSTNVWLNERIRCRHLTVGAVGDIPWA